MRRCRPPPSASVFPASAGVFLCGRASCPTGWCLPRLGGGVSVVVVSRNGRLKSSPPRRGCFRHAHLEVGRLWVFPASAGVFLVELVEIGFLFKSSPPRRGCFVGAHLGNCRDAVFPASAGVFPRKSSLTILADGLPRLGGGVSGAGYFNSHFQGSSPPRRGCFCTDRIASMRFNVFPASAGVFPSASMQADSLCGLPRLGGGVSVRNVGNPHGIRSSPPRRGCFYQSVYPPMRR